MARPQKFNPQKKQQIVISVLRGEMSVAEAARRHGSSETSVGKWRDQFVEGGVAALANGSRGPSSRELGLEREVSELTQALGEAHVELRVLKRGGAQGFGTSSWR